MQLRQYLLTPHHTDEKFLPLPISLLPNMYGYTTDSIKVYSTYLLLGNHNYLCNRMIDKGS